MFIFYFSSLPVPLSFYSPIRNFLIDQGALFFDVVKVDSKI